MFLILCVIFIFIILLYWYNEDYRYWRVRNVKHDLPLLLFGNHFKILFGMKTEIQKCTEMYTKYRNEKFVGYYRGKTPELIIRDPDLIKHILSTDFVHFYGRGLSSSKNYEGISLLSNLFHMHGDHWQILKHSLSPAFTSAKLRNMFPLIKICTERLQAVAYKLSKNEEIISAYELMARYTIEFIGACGFGVNFDTLNSESSIFLDLGKSIFTQEKWQLLLLALKELFPHNKYLQNASILKNDVQKKIRSILEVIVKEKAENQIKSNDLITLLLELEKRGTIIGQSLTKKDEKGLAVKVELQFTEMHIIAQLFIFFAGGYETSASTLSWTLYQLAHHPEIQQRVQVEIDETLSKYTDICYDAIMELKYLKMIVKEAIRTFTVGGYISRECMKRYVIPGSDVTIDPGVIITIPVQALHLDAKYYDSPFEFEPERFSQERESKRHKYVFLPFGEGPRKCIGHHLGMLEIMTGLVSILQKFYIKPASKSKQNFKTKKNSFIVQAVKDQIPILLEPRRI